MIRSPSLTKLQKSFDKRIQRLEKLTIPPPGGLYPTDRHVSYVIIEALSAWSAFMREYYLSCAWLKAKTLRGNFARPTGITFTSERDAILFAISKLKPPTVLARATAAANISSRDEPTWHDTATIIKLDGALAFTHSGQISYAISYPTSFFRDAPPIRNFFAHRNLSTAKKVDNLARAAPYSHNMVAPHEFVGTCLPYRTQALVAEWMEDLRLISYEICY